MKIDVYEQVNERWPSALPPLTRPEAARAAARLVKHFKGPRRALRVRRCWVTRKPPYSGITRGWRRLVHDISHMTFEARHPATRPHGGFHAHLEREMSEYVLEKGWLAGTLKPKVPGKPSTAERRDAKLTAALAAVVRWERRVKLANTKLKKWRRRVVTLKRTQATGQESLP